MLPKTHTSFIIRHTLLYNMAVKAHIFSDMKKMFFSLPLICILVTNEAATDIGVDFSCPPAPC